MNRRANTIRANRERPGQLISPVTTSEHPKGKYHYFAIALSQIAEAIPRRSLAAR